MGPVSLVLNPVMALYLKKIKTTEASVRPDKRKGQLIFLSWPRYSGGKVRVMNFSTIQMSFKRKQGKHFDKPSAKEGQDKLERQKQPEGGKDDIDRRALKLLQSKNL